MNFKTNIFKKKPFTWLHKMWTSQAFSHISADHSASYGATMSRSSAESINWLKHLFSLNPQVPLLATAGAPQLSAKNDTGAFGETFANKLHDITDHYRMINGDKESKNQKKSVQNGQMAPNENEVKQLGKQMDKMRTNKELKKSGLDSDPIQ